MIGLIQQHLLYCYLFIGLLAPVKPVAHTRHPLHVCTTDINLNGTEHKLEIICSIFTDDFEAALAKQYPNTKVDLSETKMHNAMDELVKKYIAGHLQIMTNGKIAPLTYIGFEKANEIVNVYMESTDKIMTLKRIDVDSNVLYDLFNDQSDIVHITVNGKRQSTKIDNPDRKVSITY